MLDDAVLKKLLTEIRTVAVVGAKDDAGQAVDMVGRYLMRAGYTVLPVHPKRTEVWGLPASAALADLPEPPDAVVLFRASEYCAEHARETLALPGKPKVFWMQLEISSPEAVELLRGSGIEVIENACVKIEHERLFGAGIGGF